MASTYAPQTTNGTTTTFLPRITPFTGDASCWDYVHNLGSYDAEASLTYMYAWDPLYGLYINSSVTCQPAEATTWAVGLSSRESLFSASSDLGNSVTLLAPFSCPGNWTAVWSSTQNPSTSATVCCPERFDVSIGYGIENDFGTVEPDVQCIYTMAQGYQDPEYALLTTETGSKPGTGWTIKTSHISASSTVLLTGYSLSGWNIQAPATSTDASQYNYSSGLSSGAKAGIGVGVALGVIFAVMVAALLYFRHRRKQKSASAPMSELQGHDEVTRMHEVEGTTLQEAAEQPRHELHGPLDRPELHESRYVPPQELDGGWEPNRLNELDASSNEERK